MGENRVFFPQPALDAWLDAGRADLVGEQLVLESGHKLDLEGALRFMAEVADGADPHDLVGTVKTLEEVAAMSGEHQADSVLLGDNAYEVVEGFVARVAEAPAVDPAVPDPVRRFFAEG